MYTSVARKERISLCFCKYQVTLQIFQPNQTQRVNELAFRVHLQLVSSDRGLVASMVEYFDGIRLSVRVQYAKDSAERTVAKFHRCATLLFEIEVLRSGS